MQNGVAPSFTNISSLSLNFEPNSPKELYPTPVAALTVNTSGVIIDKINCELLISIRMITVVKESRYMPSAWLIKKLNGFRRSHLLSASFVKTIDINNTRLALKMLLKKNDPLAAASPLTMEIYPMSKGTIWPDESETSLPLFYHAFQNNPIPMIIIDRNLMVLSVNQSYKKNFHFRDENLMHPLQYLDGFSQAALDNMMRMHVKRRFTPGSVPTWHPINIVDSNGIRRIFTLHMEFISTCRESVISIVDVSDKCLPVLQQQLPNKEELHTTFYHSPLIAFITSPSGEILEANQNFLTAAGICHDELQNRTWTEFVSPKSAESHQELLQKLKYSMLVENYELTFRFPALYPSERTVLLSARLMQFHDRPNIIFTVNDVSEVPQLTTDLFHMEELKVASEIAAGVGHEIRNPMTSVSGFLQRLSQKPDLEKYQSYFHLMLEELDRANQIITEYLLLTKSKARCIDTENLNAIIEQIFPLLQISALSSNKTILLELGPITDLQVDSKEIRQLLLNLVKNGLEAMEPNKTLTIKTHQPSPDTILLEIKDEGAGIPDHILQKIGTPFFTTKATGTGLGLSICYKIAERNNASIRIESTSNGTTFFVVFKKKER